MKVIFCVVGKSESLDYDLMLQAKQLGFSDTQIATVVQSTETAVRLVLVLEI